jgi:hypothetical protein
VYLAEMAGRGGLSTPVALKVLRRDLAPDGAAVQRLRDEGRHLARLQHPAILRVFDLVVLEGRVALVTEYVEGDDLERCLRGDAPLPPRALIEVIGRVASALHAAWTAPLGPGGGPLRLAHRDVKPSNIRVGRFGEVKLLDFGIARSDEVTREARTQTDMMIGSPPYMAPERFLDNAVRIESDLYALGATLAEGLLGERAFDLPVTMLAAHAVDRGRYDRYLEQKLAALADVPAPLLALTRQLLDHDPAARPDATVLVHRCEELSDELPGPTLADWCRQRAFSVVSVRGDWEGRVVTLEGPVDDVEPATPTLPPPPAVAGRSWLGVVVGSLSVLSATGALAALGVVVAVAVAAAAYFAPRADHGAPALVPVEAPPGAELPADPSPTTPPAPDVGLPPAPAPEPAPDRVQPAPRAEPAPPPAPAPTPPPPRPAPVAATGRVEVEGVDSAAVTRGATRLSLPADVPEGSWAWEARLPSGQAASGSLVVVAGRTAILRCSARMGCAVR